METWLLTDDLQIFPLLLSMISDISYRNFTILKNSTAIVWWSRIALFWMNLVVKIIDTSSSYFANLVD